MITGRSAAPSSAPTRSIAPPSAAGSAAGSGSAAGGSGSSASMKTTSSGRSRNVGPGRRRERGRERLVDQLGDLGRRDRGARALGERAHERDVVDLLERALAPAHLRRAAAEHDHRRVVLVRGGDRAHAVGDAGPGGQRADARLARDLRPALGGERGGRLVADVDQVDALGAAAVVEREEVPAREREQLVTPCAFSRRASSSPPCGCFSSALLGCRVPASGPALPSRLLGSTRREPYRSPTSVRRMSESVIGVVLAGGRGTPHGRVRRRPSSWAAAADRAPARALRRGRARGRRGRQARHDAAAARRSGLARAATSRRIPLAGIVAALEQAAGGPVRRLRLRHAVRDAGAARPSRRAQRAARRCRRRAGACTRCSPATTRPLLDALRGGARTQCAAARGRRATLGARDHRRAEAAALRRPGAPAVQRQHARRPGARGGAARG